MVAAVHWLMKIFNPYFFVEFNMCFVPVTCVNINMTGNYNIYANKEKRTYQLTYKNLRNETFLTHQ
jgi:hypothetical protein